MAIYHIVLFKLKPNTPPARLQEWIAAAQGMVGQIPGLQRIDLNPPDPSSASRAQGFDMGLVAVLDKPETIGVYAAHPAHLA
ncbi:uncharacterized protein HMPREF1541_03267 [Cyphellophora europaea CBS 101466]|uniref:Stress-response A/B barrel domain-containing protein n=1 Tax=Cyphellophora europaea (strain CBS 101466) TaxID=1220924 RepID=W2RY09_CYPE1|nr:uncharacterized protein HMPREF1541_03267 [Cyphellophora europaea CBS 101466]ETN41332.1 hypothetical protein HMPREF1541_03267 [Cyphellophora europaea CBS 101466]